MYRKKLLPFFLVLMFSALIAFFALLFYKDNKYQTPPPYGKDGVLSLTEADFDRPIFLIDGWLLTDDLVSRLPTYVGEYSTLQRQDLSASPHGSATYELTLRYTGAPIQLAANFPELATDYAISLDGTTLCTGRGTASTLFHLEPGDHTLTVQTHSEHGYYSGMYFPAMIGLPTTLSTIVNIRTIAYTIVTCLALLLTLFTLVLWRKHRRSVAFCLGMLCLCVSLYLSYHFVNLFSLAVLPWWQLVQGFALYSLIFCVVRLTALAAEEASRPWFITAERVLAAFPVLMLVLFMAIPVIPWAVRAHGSLKDLYFIFVFCSVVFLAIRAWQRQHSEHVYLLAASVVFGFGLLMNLLFSNLFEPILFFWQFEWCGFLLVLLFASMMIARNKRIMGENEQLTNHLEHLVAQRTQELQLLLYERKAFFSDMAHDLKAPLFATQAFIRAIRQNNTGVDGELQHYLELVEQKQAEMSRRVQGLNVISQYDRIESKPQRLSVCALLEELYATHHPEAEVSSIHLVVVPPEKDCAIFAQQEKLDILFENLIYNALRATPADGTITISAEATTTTVCIRVADTGCGIAPEELPQIFQRFYVGSQNKGTGSGLGLYIVHTILEELGGSISADSTVGVGTVFTMNFPLAKTRKTDR